MLMATAIIDWHTFFFMLFALLACVFAAAVLFTSNIVRMAFYLIVSLGSTAGLFFLAGAEFVGAMQLMIYVGGTLVLLIFGVMLTARDAFVSMRTRPGDWVLGLLVGGSLLALLLFAAFTVPSWRLDEDWAEQRGKIAASETEDTARIGLALVGQRVDKQDVKDPLLAQGLSGYLLPFEIVSVHLLVVLIGAAYLARTRRGGAASATSPRREQAVKQRVVVPSIVLGILLLIEVLNAFAGVYALLGGVTFASSFLAEAAAAPWLLPAMVLLNASRALCLLAILCFKTWGFRGLVVLSIIQPLAFAGAFFGSNWFWFNLGIAGGALVANLVIIGILYLLLRQMGRPTMWQQFE